MILGVIPARGDSKGVPKKNINEIAGKPLIAWTIEAALASKLLDRFIVSSEDEEVDRISKEFMAPVLKRPIELATDEATTLSVLQHVLEKIPHDIVVLLQPTSPIRDKGLIDNCIKMYKERKAETLVTGFYGKFREYGRDNKRRQDMKKVFYNDGNIYVINADLIKQGLMISNKVEKIVISREQNVDIDDEYDLWLAEQILLKRIKEGKLK